MGAELRGIHEDGSNDRLALGDGSLHKRQMTCVERTHGRDEAGGATLGFGPARCLLHPVNGANNFQWDFICKRLLNFYCKGYMDHILGVLKPLLLQSNARSGGLLAVVSDQIRRDGLRAELPQHGCDLAAMIARMVGKLVQALPKRI